MPWWGSTSTGLAESVGDAGAVVPTGDVAAMTRELVRRLSDRELAQREGRRGRERAVGMYDRTVTVSATAQAITELVSSLSRRAA